MTDVAELTAMIEPEVTALGFDLVRVILFGTGDDRTLQVMAERPETRQLGISDCAAVSRRLSEILDALEEAGRDPRKQKAGRRRAHLVPGLTSTLMASALMASALMASALMAPASMAPASMGCIAA